MYVKKYIDASTNQPDANDSAIQSWNNQNKRPQTEKIGEKQGLFSSDED